MTNKERQNKYLDNPVNRAKKHRRDSARKSTRKAVGSCVNCGTRPARHGRQTCSECHEYRVRTQRDATAHAIAQGLCGRGCGRVALDSMKAHSYPMCETCYFRKVSRSHFGTEANATALRDILIQQGHRCLYTGEHIVLGVNDSLDHVFPIRHFPQLKLRLSNVEWVTRAVNEMKRDRTPEQFLTLIRSILRYRQALPSGANVDALMSCVA